MFHWHHSSDHRLLKFLKCYVNGKRISESYSSSTWHIFLFPFLKIKVRTFSFLGNWPSMLGLKISKFLLNFRWSRKSLPLNIYDGTLIQRTKGQFEWTPFKLNRTTIPSKKCTCTVLFALNNTNQILCAEMKTSDE